MNHKIMFIVIFLGPAAMLLAQEPVAKIRLADRQVVEQDGHILIVTTEATHYVYSVQGESFVSSEYVPFLLQMDTTSTSFPIALTGISVFPNPARDVLIVQREITDEALRIEFFSAAGQCVLQQAWPEGVYSFQTDLQSLAAGTYIVVVSDMQQKKGNQYKLVKY